MVCIIDDREDVWNFASNLIHVKPYQFFKGVGDINAPPGSSPPEEEEEEEEEEKEEENTSSGKPVDVDIQDWNVRTEEPNFVESEGVEAKDEDAVFDENTKSEEIKNTAISEEERGFENSSESVEANVEKQEPVVDTSVEGNKTTKGIDETVEINKDSCKVLANGGNYSTDDESKREEESIETATVGENNPEGEQNNNGKTEDVEDQNLSGSNDKATCKEPQLWCEGGECHVYYTRLFVIGFSSFERGKISVFRQ